MLSNLAMYLIPDSTSTDGGLLPPSKSPTLTVPLPQALTDANEPVRCSSAPTNTGPAKPATHATTAWCRARPMPACFVSRQAAGHTGKRVHGDVSVYGHYCCRRRAKVESYLNTCWNRNLMSILHCSPASWLM